MFKERNNARLMGIMRDNMDNRTFIYHYEETGVQCEPETSEGECQAVAETLQTSTQCNIMTAGNFFANSINPTLRSGSQQEMQRVLFHWRVNWKHRTLDTRLSKAERIAQESLEAMGVTNATWQTNKEKAVLMSIKKMRRYRGKTLPRLLAARKFGIWRTNLHKHKLKLTAKSRQELRAKQMQIDSIEDLHQAAIDREIAMHQKQIEDMERTKLEEFSDKVLQIKSLRGSMDIKTAQAMEAGRKAGTLARAFRELDCSMVRIGREPVQDRSLRQMIFIWYLRARKERAVAREKHNNKKAFAKRLTQDKAKQEKVESELQKAAAEAAARAELAEVTGHTACGRMLRRAYWHIVQGQERHYVSTWRSNMHADKCRSLTQRIDATVQQVEKLDLQVKEEQGNLRSVMERHGIASQHARTEAEKALAACKTEGERQALLQAMAAKSEERKLQAVNRMRGVLKVISGEFCSPMRLKGLLAQWLWKTEVAVIQRQQLEKKRVLEIQGALSIRDMTRNHMIQRLCATANRILEEVLRHLTYIWRNNSMLAVIHETQEELAEIDEARKQLAEGKRQEAAKKKTAMIVMSVQRWASSIKYMAVSSWHASAMKAMHKKDLDDQIKAIEQDFAAQKHAMELAMKQLAESSSEDAASKHRKVEEDKRDLRKKQAAAMCLACLIRVRKMWKLKALAGFRWNMREDLVLERELKLLADMHGKDTDFKLGARGARQNFAISVLRRSFRKKSQTTAQSAIQEWRLHMQQVDSRQKELQLQKEKFETEGRLSRTGKHAGIALLTERLTKWHRGVIASIVGKWRTNCRTALSKKFAEDVKKQKKRIADLKQDGKKALAYDFLGSKLLVMGEQLLVLRQGVVARLVNNWRREAYMEVQKEAAIMSEMAMMSELMQQSVDRAAISRRGQGLATPAEYSRMTAQERTALSTAESTLMSRMSSRFGATTAGGIGVGSLGTGPPGTAMTMTTPGLTAGTPLRTVGTPWYGRVGGTAMSSTTAASSRLNTANMGQRPGTTMSMMSNTTCESVGTPGEDSGDERRYDFTADIMGRMEEMLVGIMFNFKHQKEDATPRGDDEVDPMSNPSEYVLKRLEEIQSVAAAYAFTMHAQLSSISEREAHAAASADQLGIKLKQVKMLLLWSSFAGADRAEWLEAKQAVRRWHLEANFHKFADMTQAEKEAEIARIEEAREKERVERDEREEQAREAFKAEAEAAATAAAAATTAAVAAAEAEAAAKQQEFEEESQRQQRELEDVRMSHTEASAELARATWWQALYDGTKKWMLTAAAAGGDVKSALLLSVRVRELDAAAEEIQRAKERIQEETAAKEETERLLKDALAEKEGTTAELHDKGKFADSLSIKLRDLERQVAELTGDLDKEHNLRLVTETELAKSIEKGKEARGGWLATLALKLERQHTVSRLDELQQKMSLAMTTETTKLALHNSHKEGLIITLKEDKKRSGKFSENQLEQIQALEIKLTGTEKKLETAKGQIVTLKADLERQKESFKKSQATAKEENEAAEARMQDLRGQLDSTVSNGMRLREQGRRVAIMRMLNHNEILKESRLACRFIVQYWRETAAAELTMETRATAFQNEMARQKVEAEATAEAVLKASKAAESERVAAVMRDAAVRLLSGSQDKQLQMMRAQFVSNWKLNYQQHVKEAGKVLLAQLEEERALQILHHHQIQENDKRKAVTNMGKIAKRWARESMRILTKQWELYMRMDMAEADEKIRMMEVGLYPP